MNRYRVYAFALLATALIMRFGDAVHVILKDLHGSTVKAERAFRELLALNASSVLVLRLVSLNVNWGNGSHPDDVPIRHSILSFLYAF